MLEAKYWFYAIDLDPDVADRERESIARYNPGRDERKPYVSRRGETPRAVLA